MRALYKFEKGNRILFAKGRGLMPRCMPSVVHLSVAKDVVFLEDHLVEEFLSPLRQFLEVVGKRLGCLSDSFIALLASNSWAEVGHVEQMLLVECVAAFAARLLLLRYSCLRI